MCAAAAALLGAAACGGPDSREEAQSGAEERTAVEMKDYGSEPTVLDIEEYTLANGNFRTTLWTGGNLQLTLMSVPVGGEIGLEQHPDIDQFLRIEQGEAEVRMGDSREQLDFVRPASADCAVFVPAGKWHNVVNKGEVPLKLYSIYAPAEHAHGTVHKTYEEAMAAEHEHHHHR